MTADTALNATYGDKMAPLNLMSRLYSRDRITSVTAVLTFGMHPPDTTLATYVPNYWRAKVRFGAFLSKQIDPRAAWSLDPDKLSPTISEPEARKRLEEAYRSGLLTTVPLEIGNDPDLINNTATLVMKDINVIDQFQPGESNSEVPDPANFAFALPHTDEAGVSHDSINHPSVRLYLHPFIIIDRPARAMGAGVEDTSITFHCDTKVVQNHLFTEPRTKVAEDQAVTTG